MKHKWPTRCSLRILDLGVLLLALGCLALAGCSSTTTQDPGAPAKPGEARVQGNTPGQIAKVVIDVFVENGFKAIDKRPDRLMFEKPGGRAGDIAYGNWMGGEVWYRVRVSIVSAGEATFDLRCAAWAVRDRGGATEEEVKARSAPYRKLLEEAAARFKH
jgi:hypothetical protein